LQISPLSCRELAVTINYSVLKQVQLVIDMSMQFYE
jgi:hypothetical protein